MPALVIIAVIAFVVGAFVISKKLAAQRAAELQSVAAQAGLEFSATDATRYDAMGFDLFRKGDERSWKNVMWQASNPQGARVFEYQYTTHSTDSKGNRTSSTTHHTVTVFDVPANCAHLTIGPENMATRLADHIGMRDIEFESEEFNRMFNIKCPDRQFASAFCDAQMMQWLMTNADKTRFELNNGFGIAYTSKMAPPALPAVLNFGQQFRAAIPTVVSSLFPRLDTQL